jgi:uncharacterized protein
MADRAHHPRARQGHAGPGDELVGRDALAGSAAAGQDAPMHAPFAPFADLAATLLAAVPAVEGKADGAHDRAHLLRVWHNAVQIAAGEGGLDRVLAAAVLLHDCVAVEKASPLRAQASRLAAERAGEILAGLAWPAAEIDAVRHVIAAHSFSANIRPETLPARILQDADRLDAIGAVGVARCFYTAGRMGSALYDPADPRAGQRALDDRAFAIDHFRAKLLKLGDGFQTGTGAHLAAERTRRIAEFLSQFEEEIGA